MIFTSGTGVKINYGWLKKGSFVYEILFVHYFDLFWDELNPDISQNKNKKTPCILT